MSILKNKFYREASVFRPENLLREARRQRKLTDCNVPSIVLLDPDGDVFEHLQRSSQVSFNLCWACYHSKLYSFRLGETEIGILPCIVGASYAVLVAEQLFVSGCELLISVTSAGIISQSNFSKRFLLISSAVRDEGTSYHYLPPDQIAELGNKLKGALHPGSDKDCPYFEGKSWTTDAPYRETAQAIHAMQRQEVICVEMEAAALYALAQVKNYPIVCFAHLTNSMAQAEGDFEKGEEFGSVDTLDLVDFVLKRLSSENARYL